MNVLRFAELTNAFADAESGMTAQENADKITSIMLDASHGIYEEYSKEETNKIIRNLFNKISGFDFKTATPMQRRQDWRDHRNAYYTIIEDVVADKLNSGWGEDPFFEAYVEEKNLALGDKNEFYVDENSLMQVSKFAGNHHDIVAQKVGYGKSFSVDTSWYAIKVYNDYELFRAGKIDFAAMIDKMYKSIEKYRRDAIFTAFMSANATLPADLRFDITPSASTIIDIKEAIEEVKSATGKDVVLVGRETALSKLTALVSYDCWSESMKNEKYETGKLGKWEGYDLMYIPRVNELNSRTDAFTTAQKNLIMILPVDPEFKPIKRVNEGDVAFYEDGMDGSKKNMLVSAEIAYKEGIAVVINQLYGTIDVQ